MKKQYGFKHSWLNFGNCCSSVDLDWKKYGHENAKKKLTV